MPTKELTEQARAQIVHDYDRLGAARTQEKWQARGLTQQQIAWAKAQASRTHGFAPTTPQGPVSERDKQQIIRDYARLGPQKTQAKWQARGYTCQQIAKVKADHTRENNGH